MFDCETLTSTISSVCRAYQCPEDKILSCLSENFESIYVKESPDVLFDEFLFQKVSVCLGDPIKPQQVCWFHLTRTLDCSGFSRGILPLAQAIEYVWGELLEIFKKTKHHARLVQLKQCVASNVFKLRLATPREWGPYGILVREAAFKPKEMRAWDYLAMPETIYDICEEYQSQYGDSIHQELSAKLNPVIVKFKSDHPEGQNIIKPAINYLYAKVHKKQLSLDANTCFDAKGSVVPYSDILKIDCVTC